MVAFNHLTHPSIETLYHAVGLRSAHERETVFDAKVLAKLVKLVFASRRSAQLAILVREQAVCGLFAVVGQNPLNLPRTGFVLRLEGALGSGCRLCSHCRCGASHFVRRNSHR